MNTHIRSTIFALVAGLAAAMFVAGCASSRRIAAADEQTHAYTEGMMCPKCETVWVTERKRRGPRNVTRLSYSREMTCPDCPESFLSIDNMPGTTLMGSSPTFPDTLSFADQLQWVGRLNPASPHRGMVTKPQGEFGGDSLRALSRLLTI